jgi:hypothetical protein
MHVFGHRAAKDAAAAQRAKDKAKRKGSFFGFGGSSANNKEVEERDAEQDYDDQQEVRLVGCRALVHYAVCARPAEERLKLSIQTFNKLLGCASIGFAYLSGSFLADLLRHLYSTHAII